MQKMAFRLKPSATKLKELFGCKIDGLTRESSQDSFTSVLLPWRAIHQRRRTTLVAGSQAGREVDPAGYFLCMSSVMLLTTGTGICIATLWAVLYTLPLIYLTDGSMPIAPNVFSFCAGIFGIPCCWITWASHYSRKNYTFLPLLIILLGFSLTMLSTSASLGLTYKSRIGFDMKSHPPALLSGRYQKLLNETLLSSMMKYDTDHNHHSAWDTVQQRLKCCGTTSVVDWRNTGKEIPQSCCPLLVCKNAPMYTRGCLDRVAFEIMWGACLISGLSLIVCAIQVFTLCLASWLYIKDRLNLQNSTSIVYISAGRNTTVTPP